MNINRDIQPLTTFKRDTNKIIEQLKETGEPVVLTVHGKAEVVVQDAAAYQEYADEHERMKERLETLAGIHRGLEDIKHGRVIPAREYFAEFMKVNDIAAEE